MLTGRMDQAPHWVSEAIDRDPGNWLAMNQLGALQTHTARLSDSYDTYLTASRLAAEAGDEAWHGRIEGNLGFAALDLGRYADAHQHIARAVGIGLRQGDRHSLFFIHMNLLREAAEASCWPEYEAHRAQLEAEAGVVGGRSELATLRLDRARWHLEGRRAPRDALDELDLDADPLSDIPYHLVQTRLRRMQAFLALADVASAARELALAEAVAPSVESRELGLSVLLARAALALTRGDLDEARAGFSQVLALGDDLGWLERSRNALDGLARVADATGDPTAAEDHRQRLSALRNPHGCLLRRDPSLLRGLPDDQPRDATTR
jgi:tetratricopeptide (TPR) repeat protein